MYQLVSIAEIIRERYGSAPYSNDIYISCELNLIYSFVERKGFFLFSVVSG